MSWRRSYDYLTWERKRHPYTAPGYSYLGPGGAGVPINHADRMARKHDRAYGKYWYPYLRQQESDKEFLEDIRDDPGFVPWFARGYFRLKTGIWDAYDSKYPVIGNTLDYWNKRVVSPRSGPQKRGPDPDPSGDPIQISSAPKRQRLITQNADQGSDPDPMSDVPNFARKKRLRSHRSKDDRVKKKFLSKVLIHRMWQWEMARTISTVDSSSKSMWCLGVLNDYDQLRNTLENAANAGPTTAIFPHGPLGVQLPFYNMGNQNVSDSTYICDTSMRCVFTNAHKYAVKLKIIEIGWHRDMGLIGSKSWATYGSKVAPGNLFEYLAQNAAKFVDVTVSQQLAVSQGSALVGIGNPPGPIPLQVQHKAGSPFPWKAIKPWIHLGKQTLMILQPGQSGSYTMHAPDVHYVPALHGTVINPAAATPTRTSPDTVGSLIPCAYANKTKMLMCDVQTLNLSHASDQTADPNEYYESGSNKVGVSVTMRTAVKSFALMGKTVITQDYRPDITATATERQYVDVDVDPEAP